MVKTVKCVDQFYVRGVKTGFGFVEAVMLGILEEQGRFVMAQERNTEVLIEFKNLEDLPPRTPEQEQELAWEEGLNTL